MERIARHSEQLMATILTLAVGVVIGAVLGGLGAGGGVLAVPAFILLLSMSPADAGTLSLVVVGTASLLALFTHVGQGTVLWKTGFVFGLLGAITATGGAWLARGLDSAWLLITFSALVLIVAYRLAASRNRPTISRENSEHGALRTAGSALGVGAVTGTFGAGGGSLVVPVLATVHGAAMASAVATSTLVIVMNTGLAFGSRLILGFAVDPGQAAMASAGAAAGVFFGRRLASRVADEKLRWGFVGLLSVVAVITAFTGVSELADW